MSAETSDAVMTEIALPGIVGLDASVEIADQLRDAGPEAEMCLDAAEVEQMSTPFVLTLVAAMNERNEDHPKLKVKNPSGAFTDAFTDLGLFSDMMKMEFTT